ncbi:AMP-binding protein [bacterium]|jgi:o-succinylbenzoate---CoA ligase|nr:AMP-binding protein [bacterium]MDC1221932.1 AMP-binding protein [Salibacteraceae bacterium]
MELKPLTIMSDWRDFKSLSINGTKRSLQGWRAYAQQQLQEGYGIGNLEEILEFVVDWSNRKEWVEARTSGSTGRPKNIKIKKEQILASAERTLNSLNLKSGDSALLCLPNRFIGGKMMIARTIIGDLDLYITDNTAKPELPSGIDMSFAAVVPYQMSSISKDEEATAQWQKVEKIIIGGGHVDNNLEAKLREWPNEIYESFGMTETISHVALRRISGTKEREPFKILETIDVELDDRGCLVIHSEALPTNPTITNDIVTLVDERSFHWMGRADNLINSGGVKIIPEVLEKIIKPLFNTRFFIAGLKDEDLGERVVLVLESQPLMEGDEAEVMNDMRNDLSKYEVPKEVCYVDEFVETENGKINRKKTVKLIVQSA